MDAYLIVKTMHILSATVLFGTGLGIAAMMFAGQLSTDPRAQLFAARMTARFDMIFTAPAVILQPLSGAWLISNGGYSWSESWLIATYCLYVLAGLCWLPVVFIQLRMLKMLEVREAGGAFEPDVFQRYFRLWFILGWPAFLGLIGIVWLMVAKPTW
jgi:uncharacterized membrane protein